MHIGVGGQVYRENANLDEFIQAQNMLSMQKRDVVLTAVFSSLAALILITGVGAACYFFHKRRRKRDDDDEEDGCEGGSGGGGAGMNRAEPSDKKSRLNGFLSLKTPLISTKTLG
ncbi:uncharacterized protein [Atheta coriaria]|uniref:uncharacterized protein n=1 Tax=Dalotia coriaria TaxID=877792 RepID=UPI0031F46897